MRHLVHIGYPKTASTWFQNNFYPSVANGAYIERAKVKEYFIEPGAFDFSSNQVASKLSKEYKNRILICEEMLMSGLAMWHNGMYAKELAQRIKSVIPESDIIIFIRNQINIIASVYAQYIKNGGTFSIERFLFHKERSVFNYNNLFLFSFSSLEYHKIIEYYYNLFGENKVHIYLFEDFCLDNRTFLKIFAEKFDLMIDLNTINYKPQNIKLRRNLYPLVRFINRFTSKGNLYKHYFINIPYAYSVSKIISNKFNTNIIGGKTPTSKEILGSRCYSYISEYYKKSNQELIKTYKLNNITKYGYPL